MTLAECFLCSLSFFDFVVNSSSDDDSASQLDHGDFRWAAVS